MLPDGRVVLASVMSEWNPEVYLMDYYSEVEPDEQHTLKFLVREFKKIRGRPVALEFGIGPTLHHVLPLSPHVSEIHVSDFLHANLDQISEWQEEPERAHDWSAFTRMVLQFEGVAAPTPGAVQQREDLTRERITRHLHGNADLVAPLGAQRETRYGMVLSCYCADSATAEKDVWYRYMRNIVSLVQPGGFFVMAALRNCSHYRVGDKYFASANVNETDVATLFRQTGFDMRRSTIEVEYVPEHEDAGYQSIVLASGFLQIR